MIIKNRSVLINIDLFLKCTYPIQL